ncbi:DUF341 domain protein [Cladorrhinum sp. PSN259]|nr:DUF341 domain protein [Cladorrhinum sp. PSN259]
MRFICLHGIGSSARILESQLQPFMREADPSYEFIFVDGPFRCERGPGVPAFLDGPFFSHSAGYSPDEMAEAHECLDAAIDELGPFDGVVGFSQGGALAISYMHRKQVQEQPQPFKFALIMSSVFPFSADPSDCQNAIRRLTAPRNPEPMGQDERVSIDLLKKTITEIRKNKAFLPEVDLDVYNVGRDPSLAPRFMHQLLVKEKILTPTVHVTGKRDFPFMRAMSEVARGVCDAKFVKSLEHSGGHQPPQKPVEVKAAVRAMDWAISQSQRVGHLHI